MSQQLRHSDFRLYCLCAREGAQIPAGLPE